MPTTIAKKQTAVWLSQRHQYLHFYNHSELPLESRQRMAKASAQYFLERVNYSELLEAKVAIMSEALIDDEDLPLLKSLTEEELEIVYRLWVVNFA